MIRRRFFCFPVAHTLIETSAEQFKLPVVPWVVGALCKGFLGGACASVHVKGLQPFLEHLRSGRGVLTLSNHVSVMDEPLMWGVMPLSTFMSSRTTRWTLGASDIMFTRRWGVFLFEGQVIETFRGKGIYQKAVDDAIEKLQDGQWVHMFPEGRIKQEDMHDLRRFKWGVSRILFETKHTPLVIPIWVKGFDQIMHEEAPWPRRLPRPGKHVTIIIGSPVNDVIEPNLAEYSNAFPAPWRPVTFDKDVQEDLRDEPDELADMRSRLAEVLRQKVMDLDRTRDDVQAVP